MSVTWAALATIRVHGEQVAVRRWIRGHDKQDPAGIRRPGGLLREVPAAIGIDVDLAQTGAIRIHEEQPAAIQVLALKIREITKTEHDPLPSRDQFPPDTPNPPRCDLMQAGSISVDGGRDCRLAVLVEAGEGDPAAVGRVAAQAAIGNSPADGGLFVAQSGRRIGRRTV